MTDRIEDKLTKYLTEHDVGDNIDNVDDGSDITETDPVFDIMVDLVSSLDADSLDEYQQDLLGNILDTLERLGIDTSDDGEEVDDSEVNYDLEEDTDLSEKRVQRISRKSHLTMRKNYKRNKAKFKMMNKRFRKTAAYKIWKRKHKRLVKAGRTKTKKYV